MDTLKRTWPQLFPARATITSVNVPSQTGKVIIVTGSTAGIGLETCRALYQAGATVYLAARSKDKAETAMDSITKEKTSTGSVKFLPLDLADLRTIKPFVDAFLAAETRLDILFNNAGVANKPPSQLTQQGLEPHLGTNCVGPYLLTQLLVPILASTARAPTTTPNSVRVIWSSSMLVEFLVPVEGVPPAELETPNPDQNHNYSVSKAGNWFLAARAAKQLGPLGVVSITQNPGNIYTSIFDEAPRLTVWLSTPLYYTPADGANTLLWCGVSPEVTVEDGGCYAIPFGRWHPKPRADLLDAIKDIEEGGKGYAKVFEEWCAEKTQDFR